MRRNIILWRTRSEPKQKSPIPHSARPSFFLKTLQAILTQSADDRVFLFDSQETKFNAAALANCVQHHPDSTLILESGLFGFEEFNEFMSKLPEPGLAKIILTGIGPSLAPDHFCRFLKPNSYEIVPCEHENTVLSRLDLCHFDPISGSRSGDFFSAPPITFSSEEVDGYPYYFPIKSTLPLKWGHVLSARGCPHSCTFCTKVIRETSGTQFRAKSVATLKQELSHLKDIGVNAISFADDNLTSSPAHLRSLCQMMIEMNFDFIWTAHARVDELTTELLTLMKKSGCSLIRFGLESGSTEILRYFKKSNKPEHWWANAAFIIEECGKLDIQTSGLFIIGAPGETIAMLFQTARRVLLSGLNLVQIHFFTPYADTEEFRRLKIDRAVESSHYSLFSKNYSRIPNIVLKLSFIALYLGFYLNPVTIFRFATTYNGYIRNHFKAFLKLNMGLVKIPLSLVESLRRPHV